jgi:site-specific DNA-methyltransferase (adenine-specific)
MITQLYYGDALEVLRTLPDASVHAVVTDPPSGIALMGMAWDDDRGGRAQ